MTNIIKSGIFNLGSLRGAELGAELITNGAFTTDLSGWTAGSDWSWNASSAAASDGGTASGNSLTQTITTVAGQAYQVSATVSAVSGGNPSLTINGTIVAQWYSSAPTGGTETATYTATGTSTTLSFTGGNAIWTVDDVSVRAVRNNYDSPTIKRSTRRWGGITGRSLVAPTDEHWDDVTLLLNGSHPTNNLKSGGATITNPVNGVTTTTTDPGSHPYATSFLEFNATVAKKLTIANDANVAFGNDDFTIEAWIYINSNAPVTTTASTWPVLFDARSTGSNGLIFYIQNLGSGPKLVQNLFGDRIRGTTSLAVSTWYHVALTVKDNDAKIFVDGNLEGSWYSGNNSFTPATNLSHIELGFRSYTSAAISRFNGHMADIRITKGVARDIVPPTASLSTPVYTLPTTGVLSLAEHYQSKL